MTTDKQGLIIEQGNKESNKQSMDMIMSSP